MNIRNEIIRANGFYHIYNRGIDSCKIFNNPENHIFFLNKFSEYMLEVCNVYAYCLMPNHFHFLIEVKSEQELNDFNIKQTKAIKNNGFGLHSTNNTISKQLGKFISCYTQAFNKVNNRHGALLESPFKRKEATTEEYIRKLIIYIHQNPKDLKIDFKTYKYSSYQSVISTSKTKIKKEEVIAFFDDVDNFIHCHSIFSNEDFDV